MLRTRSSKVNPNASIPANSFSRKWLWGTSGPNWLKDQRTIWLLFGGSALLLWLTGTDVSLAHLTYAPVQAKAFATFLRHYGTLPGAILAGLSLIVLLWPGLWKLRPVLYRTALVTAVTAVLGVGLINQVIVKDLANRPRPIESVLQQTATDDGFHGNSMPSGHAAMGFLLAAPFFTLRRSKPKLAAAFLGTGLVAGILVGLSRMVLGAHFATDVLIAGAITLSYASVFTHFTQNLKRIHPSITGGFIVALALVVILGNRFTNFTLTLPLNQPFKTINLPCTPFSTPTPGITVPTLTVSLNGYGAPLSNLKLVENQNIISIKRHWGLYHHLTCTATLAVPAE